MSRTIAIGDIHGCSMALAALLEAIEPQSDDLFVTLGDYIDRGPDSRGVLDQLIALNKRCRLVPLRGNHEAMLLGARDNAWSFKIWMAWGGDATLASYGNSAQIGDIPPEHWAFLESTRQNLETPTHVFAHGKEWLRMPAEPEDGRPLWPRFSGKTGIVGHAAQVNGEILDEGLIKNIDTYCYGGGWLTALEVSSGQVWQANASGKLRNR